jgi:hypothetical protein
VEGGRGGMTAGVEGEREGRARRRVNRGVGRTRRRGGRGGAPPPPSHFGTILDPGHLSLPICSMLHGTMELDAGVTRSGAVGARLPTSTPMAMVSLPRAPVPSLPAPSTMSFLLDLLHCEESAED